MGWSCRKDASDALVKWQAACRASTGSSNTWAERGEAYFYDISHTEHRDGAITGTIQKIVDGATYLAKLKADPRSNDSFFARSVGTFRIEGNGTITRGPAFLKRAVLLPVPHDAIPFHQR